MLEQEQPNNTDVCFKVPARSGRAVDMSVLKLRPRENMVGVKMVLAEYHQNTQIANSKQTFDSHV